MITTIKRLNVHTKPDDPRAVLFKDIPIGVEFDVVAPEGQYWGNPFYVKVSED